jgi:hypothetical protein
VSERENARANQLVLTSENKTKQQRKSVENAEVVVSRKNCLFKQSNLAEMCSPPGKLDNKLNYACFRGLLLSMGTRLPAELYRFGQTRESELSVSFFCLSHTHLPDTQSWSRSGKKRERICIFSHSPLLLFSH